MIVTSQTETTTQNTKTVSVRERIMASHLSKKLESS